MKVDKKYRIKNDLIFLLSILLILGCSEFESREDLNHIEIKKEMSNVKSNFDSLTNSLKKLDKVTDKFENTILSKAERVKQKIMFFDESKNENFLYCSLAPKLFQETEKDDCAFKAGELVYHLKERFILNDNGNLEEYVIMLPEGGVNYTISELRKDQKLLKSIGGENYNIEITGNKIIDSSDTLEIENIHIEEKLLITKKGKYPKNKRLRVMYHIE